MPGKKDLYIACADRWMPFAMDAEYETYGKAFDILFDPDSTEEAKASAASAMSSIPGAVTSKADYVWLPFRFEGEMAYLDWKDEWRIEDFD